MALLLCIWIMAASVPVSVAEAFPAFVKSEVMAVYREPSLVNRIGALEQYAVVKVLAYKGAVAQVGYRGYTGYARISDMTPVAQVAKPAVITADTRVYESASTSSAYVKISKGTKVNVIAVVNGVALVEYNCMGGYVPDRFLADPSAQQNGASQQIESPLPESAQPQNTQGVTATSVPAVVTAAACIVYNTSGERIAVLSKGEKVNVIQINGAWAVIERGGSYGVCLVASLAPQSQVPTDSGSAEDTAVTEKAAVTASIPATVAVDGLQVRNASGKLIGTLKKGETVNVLAVRSGTYALIERNGALGICLVSGLQRQSSPSGNDTSSGIVVLDKPMNAVVSASSVKVYNASGRLLGTLSKGAAVSVVAVRDNTWALVERGGKWGICLMSALAEKSDEAAPASGIQKFDPPIAAVVSAAQVVVYNTRGKALGILKKGTAVNIIAVRDNKWALIEKGGNTGICAFSALTKKSETEPDYKQEVFTATVISAGAKLYQKPSLSSGAVSVPLGKDVTVGGYNEKWALVEIAGVKGYMLLSDLSRTAYTTLQNGSGGESVGKLQSVLLTLGYFDSLVGSTYGSATTEAVKRFQQAVGMNVTGVADASTLRVLMSGAAPRSPLLSGTYAKGAKGSNVERIQSRLFALGYLTKNSSVDGDFGSTTQTAVKYFQTANGLSSTGNVDAATLRAMYSVSAASLPSGITAPDAVVAVQNNVTAGNQSNNSTSISKELASTTTTLPSGATNAQKIEYIIYLGQNKLGRPYVYGTSGPSTFDCTGFTCWCYKQLGIKLQRSAYTQGYDSTYPKLNSVSELRRGDLVFFNTISDSDLSDHAGIYLGAGYFIHASSGQGKVVVSTLTSGYYSRVYSWGRRVLN
ncbi:MAG: peptidoglycan-binding protein [Clostridia bacterium]|nr:peptidoglycan-binding protein [Clostridia bacterium]